MHCYYISLLNISLRSIARRLRQLAVDEIKYGMDKQDEDINDQDEDIKDLDFVLKIHNYYVDNLAECKAKLQDFNNERLEIYHKTIRVGLWCIASSPTVYLIASYIISKL